MPASIVKPASYGFVVLAALGLIDALYLTALHYSNAIPPCYVGSCEQVLNSPYSILFGVPVAVIGVAYYFFTLFCGVLYLQSHVSRALQLALLATPVGLIYSLYALVLQVWVIGAFCQYCLFSGFVSTGMFLLAGYVYFSLKRRQIDSVPRV